MKRNRKIRKSETRPVRRRDGKMKRHGTSGNGDGGEGGGLLELFRDVYSHQNARRYKERVMFGMEGDDAPGLFIRVNRAECWVANNARKSRLRRSNGPSGRQRGPLTKDK